MPDVLFAQLKPSEEVRIVPSSPTATNCVPDQAISKSPLVVPDALLVQLMPSGEVRIVPFSPTATNCVPDQTIPLGLSVVPDILLVQFIPSGEVRIVLRKPTTTNCVPDQVIFHNKGQGTDIALHVSAFVPDTVKVVAPDIAPDLAIISDVPPATPAARPRIFIVATVLVPDFQVIDEVISFVAPSEYVPVAVNCLVPATTIHGFAGSTAMDRSVAGPPLPSPSPLPEEFFLMTST